MRARRAVVLALLLDLAEQELGFGGLRRFGIAAQRAHERDVGHVDEIIGRGGAVEIRLDRDRLRLELPAQAGRSAHALDHDVERPVDEIDFDLGILAQVLETFHRATRRARHFAQELVDRHVACVHRAQDFAVLLVDVDFA